ncbi:MAG: transposase, partial [Nitrososphaerales archaeon]
FSYKGEVQMSPLVGVVGETGDVLAIRARAGNASPRRKLASFIDECVFAIPEPWRSSRQLWIRIDSAGFSRQVIDACVAHDAAFSITCIQGKKVRSAIFALASDPKTSWVPARDAEGEIKGSEIAETTYRFGKRTLRMIVRRQQKACGEQLSFDDLDGFRFHAIVTNIPPLFGDAATIEHHHRLRGGGPEEAIRQLKEDFGLNHAPLESFFANWCWWLSSALAYNVARWVRVLGLPESFKTCRGKRLRRCFFNVAARVTVSGRQLHLRLARTYSYAKAFICAAERLRALPAFA